MSTIQPLLDRQRNALRHASRLPPNDPLRILLAGAYGVAAHRQFPDLTRQFPDLTRQLFRQFWRLYVRRYQYRFNEFPFYDSLGFREERYRRDGNLKNCIARTPIDKTPIKYLP